MAANTSLQGGAALTLEQRIARIEAALRGGPPVLNAQGAPTHQDTDLGSALNAWADIFATGLVIGNARVDVAALSGSAPVYAFSASDATFEWPPEALTRCLAMVFSGVGGNGGSGATAGGATTVTIGPVTATSRAGGIQLGAVSPVRGWGTVNEHQVASQFDGYQGSAAKLFTGLSQNDVVNVSVGAGGNGGTGGTDGDPGFALLIGIA